MKRIVFFLICLCCAFDSFCQVKTPSFAKYNACPFSLGQVSCSAGWRQPTGGTCDYFNSCCTTGIVAVPGNYFGYQDNSIHAYGGLYTYSGFDFMYREYIGTKIPTLVVGNTYTMSIIVSLADSSNLATDGLGALFTTYAYTQTSYSTIPLTPQVDYSSYGPIRDKVNWVTLTGTFVADSPYTHLIVGCFKPYLSLVTDTVGKYSEPQGWISYYYIGEIGVSDSTYFGDSTYVPPIDTTTPKPPVADTADFVFPNAFTPNADNLNDVFRIMGKSGNVYNGFVLRVFNRWGECVFMSHDPQQGWDGVYNGTLQDIGVFFYLCEFTLKNTHYLEKGDVTLVQ